MDARTLPPPIVTDIRQVIYALSDALDLVGVDDTAHGKRVGIMAAACARAMGGDDAEVARHFDLGLLHDIGVSSTATHGHLVREFDWESSQSHCDVGHALLTSFAPLAWMAEPVRLHHTHWDHLPHAVAESPAGRSANLIYLVDRVDTLAAPHYGDGSLLVATREIRSRIAERAGSYFATRLVDVFLEISQSEAFWLSLEPRATQAFLADMLASGTPQPTTMGELMQLARLFSGIVDAKSPFTASHSLGVARLARHLAGRMGVPEERCDMVEIAGLLHDIGKLRVPDEILEKPARLDELERTVMNAHSFETYQILRRIPGFEDIAAWAAYHHEEPDGSGYPFRLRGSELPLEARILRVADIFQAMVQDRPYRQGLDAGELREFMRTLAAQGRIDTGVFAVADADLDSTIAAARGA